MKKTMTLLMLLMVLSSVSLTACAGPEQTVEDEETVIEEQQEMDTDGEDSDLEEDDDEDDDKDDDDVKIEGGATKIEEKDKVTTEPKVTVTYVDGTFASDGVYQAPSGAESIGVSVTLAGDVVTGLSVVSKAKADDSKRYQNLFIGGINSLVVGKKLNDIGSFSNVSGSSLTPKGFVAAIEAIKAKAAK